MSDSEEEVTIDQDEERENNNEMSDEEVDPEEIVKPQKIVKSKALLNEHMLDPDGFLVVSSMNENDLDQLIQRLEDHCSLQDTLSITTRTRKIDWKKVAFEPYSAEECRAAWTYLRSHTRKFRIMAEVIQEIKLITVKDKTKFRLRLIQSAPGFPKKPPTSPAMLFCKEMWKMCHEKPNFIIFQRECLEGFQKLDKLKQIDWQQKLDLALADYEREVKEFYSKYPNYPYELPNKKKSKRLRPVKNPGEPPVTKKPRENTRKPRNRKGYNLYPDAPVLPLNPRNEFIQFKLNKLEIPPQASELPELKEKYTGKWNKLSDRKKNKWINRIILQCGQYLEELEEYKTNNPGCKIRPFQFKNHISKGEIQIWSYFNDQPAQPVRSVFEMFLNEKLTTPDYQGYSLEECRKYAEEEFSNLSPYDKELCKINFRTFVIKYKRDIENYFDCVPDFLKPYILFLIPKKFHASLSGHVDKLSETLLLEEEDDKTVTPEIIIEPDKIDEPPKKRTKRSKDVSITENVQIPKLELQSPSKKRRDKSGEFESNYDHTGEDIEHMDTGLVLNGEDESPPFTDIEKLQGDKIKIGKNKMPDPTDYSDKKPATKRDINELIRGIFDGRQGIGRNYSHFYYYGKYVAGEKYWVTRVKIYGLVAAAQRMYETFVGLSIHKKRRFIIESWNWHKRTNLHFLSRTKFLPGEPKLPPRNAEVLYKEEMLLVSKSHQELVIPKWSEVGEEIQQLYLKRLYCDTVKYAKNYEDYIMKLRPEDMVAYTLFQCKKWEERILTQDTLKAAWRGFIFPLTKHIYNADEIGNQSDPEVLDDETYRSHVRKGILHQQSSVLDNEDFIQQIAKKVRREETTEEDLWEDSDTDDEPVTDDEQLQLMKLPATGATIRHEYEVRHKRNYRYPLDSIVNLEDRKFYPNGYTLKQLQRNKARRMKEAAENKRNILLTWKEARKARAQGLVGKASNVTKKKANEKDTPYK